MQSRDFFAKRYALRNDIENLVLRIKLVSPLPLIYFFLKCKKNYLQINAYMELAFKRH